MWYQKDSRRWTWSRTRDLMCLRHRQTPPYNRMPNSSLPQQLMGLELLRCQWPSPSSQLLDTGPPQIHTSSTESGVATCGMHFIKGKVREQRLWFTAFPFHVSPPSLSTNPSGRGIERRAGSPDSALLMVAWAQWDRAACHCIGTRPCFQTSDWGNWQVGNDWWTEHVCSLTLTTGRLIAVWARRLCQQPPTEPEPWTKTSALWNWFG